MVRRTRVPAGHEHGGEGRGGLTRTFLPPVRCLWKGVDGGVDGGDRITQALGAVLLCGVAYVVARALLAERRGQDAGQAAMGAFRFLAPGLFVGAVGLIGFLVFAALSTVVLLFAVLHLMTGEAAYGTGALVALVGGAVLLIAIVVGALWWGVNRLRTNRGW